MPNSVVPHFRCAPVFDPEFAKRARPGVTHASFQQRLCIASGPVAERSTAPVAMGTADDRSAICVVAEALIREFFTRS